MDSSSEYEEDSVEKSETVEDFSEEKTETTVQRKNRCNVFTVRENGNRRFGEK